MLLGGAVYQPLLSPSLSLGSLSGSGNQRYITTRFPLICILSSLHRRWVFKHYRPTPVSTLALVLKRVMGNEHVVALDFCVLCVCPAFYASIINGSGLKGHRSHVGGKTNCL